MTRVHIPFNYLIFVIDTIQNNHILFKKLDELEIEIRKILSFGGFKGLPFIPTFFFFPYNLIKIVYLDSI